MCFRRKALKNINLKLLLHVVRATKKHESYKDSFRQPCDHACRNYLEHHLISGTAGGVPPPPWGNFCLLKVAKIQNGAFFGKVLNWSYVEKLSYFIELFSFLGGVREWCSA